MTTPIILTKTRKLPVVLQETLVQRLRKRAEIRMKIQTRKSVLLNERDRLSELLIEAADIIDELEKECGELMDIVDRLEQAVLLRKIPEQK